MTKGGCLQNEFIIDDYGRKIKQKVHASTSKGS